MRNIAVVGLGFIGLPLSLSYSMNNSRVFGVDVNKELVNEINQGMTHHLESYNEITIQTILETELKHNRFSAHTSLQELPIEVDTYIITVGIPVKDGELNYSHLDDVAKSLAARIKKNDVVILRSTVVPGYTNEHFKLLLESSGLRAGSDFHLAYASERISEGKAFKEFVDMPLVIGGVTNKSAQEAEKVLKIVTKAETTIATKIEVVEMSKVVENIQRDVNIAMSQQFANMARKLGIDTRELINIANTHSRVNLLTPGPGVGGYCLPNAFHYLSPKAKELGLIDELSISSEARKYNDSIPEKIIGMLEKKLSERDKNLSESKIVVFGLAMKDYSNDDRISPPVAICKQLEVISNVAAYDPAVPTKYNFKMEDPYEAAKDADALLILCEQHQMFDLNYEKLVGQMNSNAFILDIKHMFKKINIKDVEIEYF